MKLKLRRLIMIILIVTFLISTAMVIRNVSITLREKSQSQRLAQEAEAARQAANIAPIGIENPEASVDDPVPEPQRILSESGILVQYDELYKRNSDLAGWIRIPDSAIDFPVMYTPGRIEKYLRRSFSGDYALSGEPFLGADWDPEGNFGIIYGHHMEDGSKCGDWMKYADQSYMESHPIVYFDTLTEMRQYQVVSAFYSKIYNQQDQVFKYYKYIALPDQETFDYYVENCKALEEYDTGVEPRWGDRLLVLSTCSRHTRNGRFVILLRQIAE